MYNQDLTEEQQAAIARLSRDPKIQEEWASQDARLRALEAVVRASETTLLYAVEQNRDLYYRENERTSKGCCRIL